jgi:ABC-type Fe3+/spermidine/putrescine transport system ATPase subunit
MAMSDRMALLSNGEVVAVDKPEALFHRPGSFAAARFMGISTYLHRDPLKLLNGEASSVDKRWAIRPERVRVQQEACEQSLPGVVSDCIFRGEYVEYQVKVNETSVRARMPMPAPVFPPGAQVYVQFPGEHLIEVKH